MAVMIGAMMIHGIQPGPNIIAKQPELFWGLIASMWIGNAMLVVLNLPMIGLWVKLLQLLGVFALVLASWMIILVHLLEVAVWAGFFLFKGAMPNYSIAYYFSLNEYTTVGSNYNLPQNWRLLEGMIATAGLLGFAWSTGVMLTLAQNFQVHRMQLLKRWRENRLSKSADRRS
jgi:hypothetical protein